MAILNFSDVLKNVGLDPKDVKLIRHLLFQLTVLLAQCLVLFLQCHNLFMAPSTGVLPELSLVDKIADHSADQYTQQKYHDFHDPCTYTELLYIGICCV